MPAIVIEQELTIERTAGNDTEVVITVPELLPLAGSAVRFGVLPASQDTTKPHIMKTTPAISVAGQVITVPISRADSKNLAGKYRWELDVEVGGRLTTIGRGDFLFTKKRLQ